MSKKHGEKICDKKAFGSALVGLGVVFLIVVAYSAINYGSLKDPQNQQSSGIIKIASVSELEKYLAENSDNMGYNYGGTMARSFSVTEQSAVAGAGKSASDSGAPAGGVSDHSQTNIQVAGVDEADIVKTDGKYIYTVSGNHIVIVEAEPAENAKVLSKISFNGSVNEIFLSGDNLVIFGQVYEKGGEPTPVEKDGVAASEKAAVSGIMPPIRYSPKTDILIYNVADRASPAMLSEISIEGDYYDSRMIGNYVYVIANQPTYYLYDANNNVTVPRIYLNGNAVSTAFPDMYYFEDIPGNVFTTIASINLENPQNIASKILLTNYAQNMYVSEKNIYITYTKWMSEYDYVERMVDIIMPLVPSDVRAKINAAMALEISKQTKMQAVTEILAKYSASLSSEERQAFEDAASEKMQELADQIAKEREKTIIQKIAIDNGNIEYKKSGEVPGNTLNQFSMDENNGYYRIATTTSGNGGRIVPMGIITSARGAAEPAMQSAVSEADSSAPTGNAVAETSASPAAASQPAGPLNHIYVLDGDLNIVGKLENLAAGERIYSVRFLGDKAYMVTFRQMDPLFVIDLSAPEDPKVLGYLKIQGVSDYLHPYDETHIIGLGRDATDEGRIKGMKLSLFDVSDFANPKEISKYVIGDRGTYSDALYDHKAFLFSKEKSLLVIPVSEYTTTPVAGKQEWEWQGKYWQGAYVFNIGLPDGITLKGRVTHANETASEEERYYYDYNTQIRRSLYIGNVLYTISQKMIKMNALDTLGDINKVDMPFEEQNYYGGIYY